MVTVDTRQIITSIIDKQCTELSSEHYIIIEDLNITLIK